YIGGIGLHFSAFSLALIILLLLPCPCNLVNAFTVKNQNQEDVCAINNLIQEAVEYSGWINEPDYEKRMANFFAGELLYDLLDRVERFRNNDTDWHSLTFVTDCHIVYNNGKTAVVHTFLKESDANTGDSIYG